MIGVSLLIPNILSSTTTYTREYIALPVYAEQTPLEAPTVPIVEPKLEEYPEDQIRYNCYLYLKSRLPNLPQTKYLTGNSIAPVKGGLAILDYNGQPHYIYIEDVVTSGLIISQSNIPKGEIQEFKFLSWEYLSAHKVKYHRL